MFRFFIWKVCINCFSTCCLYRCVVTQEVHQYLNNSIWYITFGMNFWTDDEYEDLTNPWVMITSENYLVILSRFSILMLWFNLTGSSAPYNLVFHSNEVGWGREQKKQRKCEKLWLQEQFNLKEKKINLKNSTTVVIKKTWCTVSWPVLASNGIPLANSPLFYCPAWHHVI